MCQHCNFDREKHEVLAELVLFLDDNDVSAHSSVVEALKTGKIQPVELMAFIAWLNECIEVFMEALVRIQLGESLTKLPNIPEA